MEADSEFFLLPRDEFPDHDVSMGENLKVFRETLVREAFSYDFTSEPPCARTHGSK